MTPPRYPRWRRSAMLLAAGLLTGGLTVSMAAPAMADPTPVPTVPTTGGSTATTPPAGSITWAVQPSTAEGPDRRSAFTYSNIAPGTIVHDYVGVTNFSKMPVTFAVYASDAFNTESGSLDMLPASEQSKDVGSWVTIPKTSITIDPGARVNEPVTLTVPFNAAPGDHIGGIIASVSTAAADPNNKKVHVDRRLAVPIYLRVAGPLHSAVAIESSGATYHATFNPFGGGNTDVSYTIHNTGNTRLDVTDDVELSGLFGLSLGSSPAATLKDLLPGSTLRITRHIAGVFPLGPVTAHIHAVPADVAGVPQSSSVPAKQSRDTSLWTTPWPQLGLLALLVLIFFGTRWWVRRGRRRTQETVDVAVAKARRETAAQLSGAEPTKVGSGVGSGVGRADGRGDEDASG